MIVIWSPRSEEHQTPPGHPESPARAKVMGEVVEVWKRRGGEVRAPSVAALTQLARVHSLEYLDSIIGTAGRSVALDPDTYTSPETAEIALLAAGAAIDAVNYVLEGERRRAFAFVRPPGHHAERHRAMGFCFYNNVAAAAAEARAQGVERVAIIDYDVHHGNGTQYLFDDDPTVLYISLHQFPAYPGTGAVDEVGTGPGTGSTVNLPLEAGAGDEDYRLLFSEIVLPILRQFDPGVLLVSAGFDAHAHDPLADMRVSSEGFGAMTAELRLVAEECADGRVALVTEGGYNLHALGESLTAALEAIGPERAPEPRWPRSSATPARGQRTAAAARAVLAQFWQI